jgi:hypothetical protein
MKTEWLREQAARLFTMADDASRKGDQYLADLLNEGACRCVDRLNVLEGKTPSDRQPATQQKQPKEEE